MAEKNGVLYYNHSVDSFTYIHQIFGDKYRAHSGWTNCIFIYGRELNGIVVCRGFHSEYDLFDYVFVFFIKYKKKIK